MHFSRAFDFISEITVVSNDDRWACDCDLWPDVAWFYRMELYMERWMALYEKYYMLSMLWSVMVLWITWE